MKNGMILALALLLGGCISFRPNLALEATQGAAATEAESSMETQVAASVSTPQITDTPQVSEAAFLPSFDHIVLIVLENQYLQDVLNGDQMPALRNLAEKNVLLSNYFAVAHPSLPNYLALISGSTQGVTSNCLDCFFNTTTLPDEIESGGRTWKGYFEDMPAPCTIGSKKPYAQYFNPFIYFDPIRINSVRCDRSVVPFDQLSNDLAAGTLPDFSLIIPSMCNSGHDCPASVSDMWLDDTMTEINGASALTKNSLIIITFDEGVEQTNDTRTHGEIMTVLISPLAKAGYVDDIRYTHYSLLKTILTAWHLPLLGQTAAPSVPVIAAPWMNQLGYNHR